MFFWKMHDVRYRLCEVGITTALVGGMMSKRTYYSLFKNLCLKDYNGDDPDYRKLSVHKI